MNKTKRLPRLAPGRLCFTVLGAFCILLLLFYAEGGIKAAQQGLLLCGRTVIPALFPFMVASELLVGCGGAALIGTILAKPMQFLLGIPGAAACPVVLGALCGFPTGARTMAALYDKGELSAAQCTRLLTFINNPSSAYMISAVGASLLGSRRMGLLLWIISLLCAFLTACATRFLMPDDNRHAQNAPQPLQIGAHVFTSAIGSAAQSMLSVCAYVVFFSAVLGAVQSACEGLAIPPTLNAVLYGIMEMSGGIAKATQIGDPTKAAVLCAALSCFSGISVMCQIITVCHGRGFGFWPYVLAKIAQSVLAAAMTWLAIRYLLPLLPPEDMSAGLLLPEGTTKIVITVSNASFGIACVALMWRKAKRHLARWPADAQSISSTDRVP